MSQLNELQCNLINELNILNTSKKTIAERVHCNRSTVYYQLEKIKPRDGSNGTLQRRKRKKGGYKVTEQIKANILRYVLENRFCTNREIIVKLSLEIKSETTITKILKELGIGSFVAVVKQYLSLTNKNKRLLYAINVLDWTLLWRTVVFSDEKTYHSSLIIKPRIKRMRGERYNPDNMIGHANITSVKVNIWAFMVYGVGVRAFLVDDNFNSSMYIDCIRDNFFNRHGSSDYIFQQDNCSIHKTPRVIEFFRERSVTILNHPPISPDLNPMENAFNLSQRKLNHYLLSNFINSKVELFNIVREFLETIEVEMVNNLIDSMPSRVQQVRLNHGDHTRY